MGARQQHGGKCQCGVVRYAVEGPIQKIYVCHCTECRKQSASAFGLSAVVDRKAFRLTHGSPKKWSRLADSGRTVDCYFCPDCGSRLWHEDAEGKHPIRIKAGSLDEPVELDGAIHIWTSRKLPGVIVPESAVQHAQGEPPAD